MKRLREIAEAAPPRPPWDGLGERVEAALSGQDHFYAVDHAAWAEHIVTFDRPTVLALLDVAEAAEAALPELVEDEDPDTVPVANLGEPERRLRKSLARLREVSG